MGGWRAQHAARCLSAPALKRPRASAAAAPSPPRRPAAKCERVASRAPPRAHRLASLARTTPLRIHLGALRDDGTAIGSERALAPARPAPTPAPAPPRHDDDAHSLEADGLQGLIVVPGSLC